MEKLKVLNIKSKHCGFVFAVLLLFSSMESFAQSITINGVVSDQLGQPLPGASVLVRGTTTGTTTDFDGNYSLSVADDAILVVSYLGFITQELAVNGRALINITLAEDAQGLDEVVVIGYGSVKKSDLTGSVVSIKTEKIADIPTNNVGTLLQGRSTGLQIINISDDPEGGVGVRVRGASSLVGSREPLVVLDGIPFGTLGDLNQLAPGDIKSVEVLKDASAAAIYGSQGANGVILVTTKKGKKGNTEVFVEMNTTVAEYPEKIQRFTDMSQLARLRNERDANDGAPLLFSGQTLNEVYYPTPEEFDSGAYRFHDWLPVTRNMNPLIYNLRAGVRGGSEKNNYNLSLNYFNQEQNVIGASYDKINLLFNDAINVNDKMKIIASVNLTNTNRVNGTGGDFTNGNKQWYPIYNEDGSYFIPFDGYTHQLEQKDDYYNEAKGFDVLTNLNLVWEPIAGLTFSSSASYNRTSTRQDSYIKSKYTEMQNDYSGIGFVKNFYRKQSYFINTLTYSKEFGNHNVSLMVGRDDQIIIGGMEGIEGRDFDTDALLNENLPLATPEDQRIFQGYSRQDLLSYFGRANYSFKDRYLLTLTFRADGSSKFGEDKKWGYFPAVGLAWKAHEESFIKNLNTFDFLKLRLSGGQTGNQGIDPYQSIERFGSAFFFDAETGSVVNAGGPGNQIANPNLQWETTTQYNAALETGFFNNKLRFSAEAYFKQTTDLLRPKFLPSSGSFDTQLVNDGVIDNYGIEFDLGGNIITRKDFSLDANILFSMNKNEVVDIGTTEDAGLVEENGYRYVVSSTGGGDIIRQIYAIGQPLNAFYGYVFDGFINTYEDKDFAQGNYTEFGRPKFVDQNNDGIINEADRVILGNPTPDFTASLSLSAKYKNFYVEMLFNAVVGNEIFDVERTSRPANRLDAWSTNNQEAQHPINQNAEYLPSSYNVVDGSFLRFQNLTLGYNLDIPNQNIFKKLKLYCNVSNIFVIHNYEGYDPEVGFNTSTGVATGVSNSTVWWDYSGEFPRQRRFTLGLNMTF
jgi:TonB-linked SusC/RagA family outer membrane protein